MNALFPALPPVETAAEGADVAYTPEEVVSVLLRPEMARAIIPPMVEQVWEPCAGGGAWIRALRARRPHMTIHGTEIDPAAASIRAGLAVHGDAFRSASCPWAETPGARYEIWTNPPFSLAGDLLRAWFDFPNPPERVILLLLQAWPNAGERAWVWPHMHREIVLYPRISFDGPGRKAKQTDQRDYSIFEFTPTCRVSWHSIAKKRLDWRRGFYRDNKPRGQNDRPSVSAQARPHRRPHGQGRPRQPRGGGVPGAAGGDDGGGGSARGGMAQRRGSLPHADRPHPPLTLWPEFAWCVEALDKRVENRTWPLPSRWIGQRVYLHAGAYPGDAAHRRRLGGVREMSARAGWVSARPPALRMSKGGIVAPELCQGMRCGALIGVLHLTGCDAPHEGDLGGWRAPEQFGWRFEFEPIAEPIAARGALGFWRVAT